jgi:hypothetical protein
MTLTFQHAISKLRKQQYNEAERNIIQLMRLLPASQQILLEHLDTTFKLYEHEDESGGCDYPLRTIELNVLDFSRFTFSKNRMGHNQRWALSTLKEEVIHYLAEDLGFDSSKAWKNAVAQESAASNPLRDKLIRKQRKFDSAEDEEKLTPQEYEVDQSIFQKVGMFLTNRSERAEEWLVDIILIRDYLRAKGDDPAVIDEKMSEAFPQTYAMAMEFEASIDSKAAQIGPIESHLAELHAKYKVR